MTYSTNFRKKVGNTSGEEPVYLLEITHPQLVEPVRVVRDNKDLTRGHHALLPGTQDNYFKTPDSIYAVPSQNWCIHSENMAGWTDISTVTVTSNAYADPNGEMTVDTLTDDNAAAYEGKTLVVTVPNDASVWRVGALVLKDAGATQRAGFNLSLTGGTAVNVNARFALDGTNVSGCTVVSYDDDYWFIEATITNNTTGNVTLSVAFYPATSATKGGGDNVAAVGSMSVGWVRFQRSARALPYYKTTGNINKGQYEIEIDMAPNDYTPAAYQEIVSKKPGGTEYLMRLNATGTMTLFWGTEAGTTDSVASSALSGLANGERRKFKAQVNSCNASNQKELKLFTSVDGGTSWQQFGSTVTGTSSYMYFESGNELRVGFRTASAGAFGGKVYSFKFRPVIDGAVTVSFDAEDFVVGAASAVSEETGETWTANTSGTPAAAIVADETYIALAFDIQLPDDVEGKLSRIPLKIDNVGRELTQWLDASRGGIGAQARVMQVMRDEPDVLEFDVTMDLLNVRQNGAFVTGELGYENTLGLAAMVAQYRPDNTPGLF